LTEPVATNAVTGSCLLLLLKYYGYFQWEEAALSLVNPGKVSPMLLTD